MQYMLLIYGDEAGWNARTDDERRALNQGYEGLTRDLQAAGKLAGASELQPVGTATTLRVRNGDAIVSDGPFAETKEVLGGYYLIDVESLDEALEWAAKIPGAGYGTIEVRPIVTDYEAMLA
jgi:hypothetical protein